MALNVLVQRRLARRSLARELVDEAPVGALVPARG